MKEGVLPWLIVFGLVCIGIKTTIDIFEENPVPPLKLGLWDSDPVDADEEMVWERESGGFSIMMDEREQEAMIIDVKNGGKEVIPLADITRIKKVGKDAYIYKNDKSSIVAKRIALRTLEQKLGSQSTHFFKTKSDLINLKYVRSVKSENVSEKGKNYQFTIYLDDGNKVSLSHERKDSFMSKLRAINGIPEN